MPHTLSWCHFGNVLKCPLSTNKVGTSIRKARIQQRTLYMPKVQEETISLESHVLWGVGHPPQAAYRTRRGYPIFLWEAVQNFRWNSSPLPTTVEPEHGIPGAQPQSLHQIARTLIPRPCWSRKQRNLQKWKCSLTPRDQKGKSQ